MLFFLTGEGRVPRFVLLPIGIFCCLSLYDYIYKRLLLRAFFLFSPPHPLPSFVVLLAGVWLPPVSSEIPDIYVQYTITIQPFGYYLGVSRR